MLKKITLFAFMTFAISTNLYANNHYNKCSAYINKVAEKYLLEEHPIGEMLDFFSYYDREQGESFNNAVDIMVKSHEDFIEANGEENVPLIFPFAEIGLIAKDIALDRYNQLATNPNITKESIECLLRFREKTNAFFQFLLKSIEEEYGDTELFNHLIEEFS